jgi:hypothetical protein
MRAGSGDWAWARDGGKSNAMPRQNGTKRFGRNGFIAVLRFRCASLRMVFKGKMSEFFTALE